MLNNIRVSEILAFRDQYLVCNFSDLLHSLYVESNNSHCYHIEDHVVDTSEGHNSLRIYFGCTNLLLNSVC